MATQKITATDMSASMGAIKSPYDYRDIPLAAVSPVTASLPTSFFVDISQLPVWHQRAIGACVGHAFAKYKQKLDLSLDKELFPLSARYLYAMAKSVDGVSGEGTFPRVVAQILKDSGVATEATCVNDTTLQHEVYVYNRNSNNIPVTAHQEALGFKTKGYAFVNPKNITELKQAIVNFEGASLLMRVGEEWWKSAKGVTSWAPKDISPLRPPKVIVSGHQVYLYGYEDVVENGVTRTKFYIFNSWSDAWANKGTNWFYYDEMVAFLDEAITMVDIPTHVIDQVKKLPTNDEFAYTFKYDLRKGDTGEAVTALQTALMIDGVFSKDLYAQLLQKNQLGYYGGETARAVKAYQTKYKFVGFTEIMYLNGTLVGPKTRAHLNVWTSI